MKKIYSIGLVLLGLLMVTLTFIETLEHEVKSIILLLIIFFSGFIGNYGSYVILNKPHMSRIFIITLIFIFTLSLVSVAYLDSFLTIYFMKFLIGFYIMSFGILRLYKNKKENKT